MIMQWTVQGHKKITHLTKNYNQNQNLHSKPKAKSHLNCSSPIVINLADVGQ